MDYDRQRALGRWAEWAGSTALSEDRLMRTFRLERAARADWQVSSPAARVMLKAYTAGVNAFMTTTRLFPHRIHHPGHHTGALGALALPGSLQSA